MNNSNASDEQATTASGRTVAAISHGHRALIGTATLCAVLVAGWFGSGVLAPSVEVGAADGIASAVSIKNCEASWLHQKVDALGKRCHLANIDVLKVRENEVFRQFVDLAVQWPQVYMNGDYTSPNIAEEVKQLIWPEENALRQTVDRLIGANDLRSLASAQNIYLARLKEVSGSIVSLQKRIDFSNTKAKERAAQASQPSPHSTTPASASSAFTVPIVGKSGPFNIYAIEPKDDLDALHYFIGNERVEPDMLVGILPVIEKSTAEQHGLRCQFLCADAEGNIVGRARIHADARSK